MRSGGEIVHVTKADIARFYSYVLQTSTCWIWTGGLTDKGYGRFKVDGRMIRAHKFMLEEICGETVPEGMTIDHTCRVRTCVRRKHLVVVTDVENTLRAMERAGRIVR